MDKYLKKANEIYNRARRGQNRELTDAEVKEIEKLMAKHERYIEKNRPGQKGCRFW